MNSDVIERTDVSHLRKLKPFNNSSANDTPHAATVAPSTNVVTSHPSGAFLEELFQFSPYAALRALKVRCERDVVVVEGKVPSFYLRQLALSITKRQLPESYIVDFIEVAYV